MSTVIMYHFTDNKNLILNNTIVNQEFRNFTYKPSGLWVTDMGEPYNWFNWCLQENFSIDKLKYQYKIEIDITKIKIVDTLDKFERFHNYYYDCVVNGVSWDTLAEYYKGIIISPYRNDRSSIKNYNFYKDWYYGWDVASGCIWDTSCIANIELSKSYKYSELKKLVNWED